MDPRGSRLSLLTEVVVDASVAGQWYRTEGELNVEAAQTLLRAYQQGTLMIVVPPILAFELLNIAARRWRWDVARLAGLAEALDGLALDVVMPALGRVAEWASAGLTAYDASYVAVAEQRGVQLVTADEQILRVAPAIARRLTLG